MAESLGLRIPFLERVSDSEIPRLYRGATIFLTTSRSEGFGLALLEAMASRCAVVASDIPAHRELVTDGESGLIYHPPEELEACLKRLLEDEKLRAKLGPGGRDVARQLSWQNVSLKVLDAYHSVLSRGNAW